MLLPYHLPDIRRSFGAGKGSGAWRGENIKAQLRAQSGAQSHFVLAALSETPRSAAELTEILGLESKTGAFKRTIKDLLKQALIEYTIPDKPSSRLQKYRLTPKGREILKKKK